MFPGDVLGDRFEIERLAAQGGMGRVFRGRDRLADETVAIKVVEPQSPHALERFAREARVLLELRHPAIVRYLAHGRARSGELWLAMEWLEGEDLGARLAERELTLAESVSVVTQASAALAAAHARRIVHRDIKPSNLFLVEWRPERLKLLDFGIARLGRGDSVTATGAAVGTPSYMAPEQARNAKEADARADVYALGSVLYRCLGGRPPFGSRSTAEMLAVLISDDEAPPLRELRGDIPAPLEALVARMLAKDPERRPRDAAAVLAELVALTVDPAETQVAPREIGGGERRIVSVIVAGAPLGETALALIRAHGGRIEPHGDGAVRIVCAGHRLATDQAVQAARLALAVHRAEPAIPLAVVTGRGDEGATRPTAHTLRRAAGGRDAPPIRIDEVTAGLLGSGFRVAGAEAGLELSGAEEDEDAERLLLGRPTPFVGREREVSLIEGIAAACFAEPEAHAVLLIAPAGTGKSRLRRELMRRLRGRGEPVEIWLGRGDPMRAGAPFGLLGEAIRRAAGLTGGEPPAVCRAQLHRRVARTVRGDAAERIAAFLGEIAGIPFSPDENVQLHAARADLSLLNDQMRRAWEDWLAAELAVQPVVLVLEDLHWGDLPTIKLVDAALKTHAERPLFVLGAARAEVHEVFPNLWSARRLNEIHLGELSRRAAERLCRLLLGETHPAVAAVVDRAAGNAFFLEELIRDAAAGGGARPETVLAMLAARLQALDADARRVLRVASVFGEAFWEAGVRALVGDGAALDHWLDVLVDNEVIERRDRSRFPGADEYVFRHSLVREATYLMLTDADRELAHRLAGGWLERSGETEAIVVAEHFERGREPALAIGWYLRAAEQALAANDPEAAAARAERGVAGGAGGEILGLLRLIQAEAHRWLGNNDRTEQGSLEAMRLLPAGSEAWYQAAGEAAAAMGKLNHHDALCALADELTSAGAGAGGHARAVALLRTASQCFLSVEADRGRALVALVPDTSDPRVAAWLAEARGWDAFCAGDDWAASEHISAAILAYEAVGDRRNACIARVNRVQVLLYLGRLEEAEPLARQAIREADALSLAAAQMGRAMFVQVLLWMGRNDEAMALALEAVERFPRTGQPRILCSALMSLGLALVAKGDLAAGEARLREACALGVAAFPRILEAQGWLGAAVLRQGRAIEALEITAEARQLCRRGFHAHDWVYLLARAEAFRALGRSAEAGAEIAEARNAVTARADSIPDASARARFLERNPIAARAMALAKEWLAEG